MITTIQLAQKVRTARLLQTRYFRTPKDKPSERQAALKAAKACEAELDKMVDNILNPTDGR